MLLAAGLGVCLACAPDCQGVPAIPSEPGPSIPSISGVAYYVAVTGNDASPGNEDAPWRTIARALPVLRPGDGLFLRGGTYFERAITVARSGTPTAPITIWNHPHETVVIDGSWPEFRSAGNQDWVVHDATRGIYRSVKQFRGVGQVYGYLGPRDGGFRLVPYESYSALSALNEDYSATIPYYVGPGVFWNSNDERIYVRLTYSRYQTRLGFPVPANTDPRATELFLFPDDSLFDVADTAAYVVFDGIALRHGGKLLDLPGGCHHLTFRRCDFQAGRYEVVVRGGAHDLVFDSLTFRGRFPPWVARSDVKMPSGAAPAHLLQGAAIELQSGVQGVEIANSSFSGLFDAIDTAGAVSNLHIHHSRFTTIRDDAVELATGGRGFDLHDNTIRIAAAGVSWNGSNSAVSQAIGTKYVHHNVIDTSTRQLYGRDDPQGLLPSRWRGPAGDGIATGTPFATHDTASLPGPDPWKVYHNTIVGAEDVDDSGFGVSYRFGPFNPSIPHEVFNNVFVQVADHPVIQYARVADGSQVFDGNLYYRSAVNPGSALLQDFINGTNNRSYARLADFLASSQWQATRVRYPPGWEAAGVEANPVLDAVYRAAANGPAATGAINLSGRGWPGATVPYRGALPPR